MIVIPTAKPLLLKALETDFGTTIARTIWKRIQEQEAWVNANVPIGIIIWFYASQTYANSSPIASPNQAWQFCDGSLISNADSPLNGLNTPDLRGLFPKFVDTNGGIGTLGGIPSFSLNHNHGGATQGASSCDGSGSNPGGDHGSGGYHTHSIGGDLGTYNVLPPYIDLQPYVRIL